MRRSTGRLRRNTPISMLLPAAHQTAFDDALRQVPEPLRDSVQRSWREFLATAQQQSLLGRLTAHAAETWVRDVPVVWSCSDFVARACCREPAMLVDLLESGRLQRATRPGEIAECVASAVDAPADADDLGVRLRRLRRRELVRVAWRDIAKHGDLAELTSAVSELAEACLEHALEHLYRWSAATHGRPVGRSSGRAITLVVLGLGKLGGGELNFSSDIDLIFAYPEDGETEGGRTSNHEFFLRLARRLIKALDEITAEGFVFRTDMRLRPNGESGPLVLSADAMEHYYQTHGRDWERYALIKARVVAGDRGAGEQLLATLRPFVYRRYLDYGAFDAIRSMTTLIERELDRKGVKDNIKLGRGGIREIEFIAQSYQLIRGGRESALRTQKLMQVLDHLAESGVVNESAVDALRRAYGFLRRIEHRLQMVADQQVHTLPTEDTARVRLAYGMGFPDWETLTSELRTIMGGVHQQFRQTFSWTSAPSVSTQAAPNPAADLWLGTLDAKTEITTLQGLGYDAPAEVQRLLERLRGGALYKAFSQSGRDRLDKLLPMMIAKAGQAPGSPSETIAHLVNVIESVGRRTAYLTLLIENPLALTQLVGLCAASPWISRWIAQHPVMLDELLYPISSTETRDRDSLESQLARRLDNAAEQDLELQMEILREFRHGHVLRVAAADIADQLSGLAVSRQLCNVAEAILRQVLRLSRAGLLPRYGEPRCGGNAGDQTPDFGIVAYGKLGSVELGYNSDLDIIFVFEPCADARAGRVGATVDGSRSIPNDEYFSRLARRIVHFLTTRTPTGLLYEIDMRLRPSGRSGTLVTSVDAFEAYQKHQAWTWEHQALVRTRMIVGGDELTTAFEAIRRDVLCQPRDEGGLKEEIRSMRERMTRANCRSDDTHFDLKLGSGGIVDIEFIVQYYVLRWAHAEPTITEPRDNIGQLRRLNECGLIADEPARTLKGAYERFLATEHHLKLLDRPSLVGSDELLDLRQAVSTLWRQTLQ